MQLFARVNSTAREVSVTVLIFTVLAAPFYAIGWLVGSAVRLVVWLLAWGAAAVKVGFVDGRGEH